MTRYLLLSFLSISQTALAGIVPPNEMRIDSFAHSGIPREDAQRIVNDAMKPFIEIAKRFGVELDANVMWENPKVNAAAGEEGKKWTVYIYGGLLRHPLMTNDGLALVVCHELGHHFGGYPFYIVNGLNWSTTEGQADTFATQSCLKTIWKNTTFQGQVDTVAKQRCDAQYSQASEAQVCYRSAMAGLDVARFIASLETDNPDVKFDTPDTRFLRNTDSLHPPSQCRLDTFLNGAICPKAWNQKRIAGRPSPATTSANDGNTAAVERDAAQDTCFVQDGFLTNNRPRCWFSPISSYEGLISLGLFANEQGRDVGFVRPGVEASVALSLKNRMTTPREEGRIQFRFPDGGGKVLTPEAVVPTARRGETISSQFSQIVVDNLVECGTDLPLDFIVSDKQGAIDGRISLPVGELKMATALQSLQPQPIPDRSSLFSSLTLMPTSTVRAVQVSVDLSHEFLSDLRISLVLPDGTEQFIEKISGQIGNRDFKKSWKKYLYDPVSVKGEWQLKITDTQSGAAGTLHAWSLAPYYGSCSR